MSISVLVGTYTDKMPHVPDAKGEGVYVYNLKSTDGSIALTHQHTIPNVINPTYLEITNNKQYLYAVTESPSIDKSLIHGFKIDRSDAKPSFQYIDSWPIGGIGACHIRIDDQDRFVFISNYDGGSAAVFEIDGESGKLTKRGFVQFTEHSSVNEKRQDAPHAHSIILDRSMRFVYLADLGNDCIWRMDYSNEFGFVNGSKRKFPSPPGSGPRHMVFHPINQKYLYVTAELIDHILVYEVKENGDLVQIQDEPTAPRVVTYNGPMGTADIHTSPDGRFVYITTRFIDIVSVFQIEGDGKIKFVQEIDSGGKIPRNFVMYHPRNLLLVANQDTNDVTVFNRDTASGRLSQAGKAQVNTPVCLKILD